MAFLCASSDLLCSPIEDKAKPYKTTTAISSTERNLLRIAGGFFLAKELQELEAITNNKLLGKQSEPSMCMQICCPYQAQDR